MSDRWEWVEIIEPRTKERMYANLTTGECVWDPPPGVRIKKTDNNQWWELFDQNTSRFYYYNASLQKTAWHRPTNCDIIPLAKLQTLKQNTEVSDRPRPVRKEISTQTPAGHAHAKRGLDLQTSHSCQTSPHQTARHHSRSHNRSQRHNQSSTSSPLQQDQTRFQPNVADNNERPGRSFHHKPKSTNSNSNAYPFYDNASGSPRHPCDEAISQRMSPDVNPAFDISKQFELPVKSTGTDGLCSGRGPTTADQQVPFHSPPHVRHHPVFFVRQGSFPFATYDDPSDYFGDLTGQQQNTALITAVQVTPRPKPRAFPRTNPAYVGMHRHDGAQAYKKVGVEQQQVQQQPATAVYNQYFYDLNSQLLPFTGHSSSSSQGYPGDFVDRRKFRHEQSDSDTSHSSFGISRLHQADVNDGTGQSGMSARPIFRRDQFSDSLSSQGSLRGRPDLHSSQGSLGFHDKDCMTATSPLDSLSSHSSPRHIVPEIDHVAPYQQSYQVASGFRDRFKQDFVRPDEVAGVRARRNSEPDYANLPAISQARSNKEEVLQRERREKTAPSFALATEEQRSGDSLPSADSLSPTEFTKRQDTPSSVRSGSTHHSIASHTSEGLPDQGFEDSDNSSLFSSPSPKDRHRHNHSSLMPSQTQHPSLLRRKMLEKLEKVEMEQSAMENSLSLEVDLVRPLSLLLTSQSEEDLSNNLTSDLNNRMMAIEQFAMENLNEHRRGLLGKTVPIGNMLTWTKDIISKPMIRTNDKIVKKEAPEVFKLIQMYMGDRKAKTTSIQVALEIVTKGWSLVELRDEIFIQLSRQTCQNPRDESLMHGWELLGVCLSIFPPSYRFHSYLEGYIYRNLDPVSDTEKVPVSHFAAHCQRRLDRIVKSGAKRGLRKPTVDEIEQALKSIFHPSMFGNTLDEVMLMQKERCPDRQLPWIQTTLSEEVLHLNGAQTEGIFRVPGDIDEVNTMKALCDQWNPPTNCSEPHSPASLLKLWYRELYEPLIPPEFYEQCVNNYSDSEAAIGIVNSLPHINRLVLSYLIRFLQVFAAPANASVTKMDASNLAMVMAPNCLRCESDDPSVIFENTRKEMAFIRTLIQNLDTSFMDGVI